ncbi:uncharacterized protein N7469_007518 [Penicillium citrinum]|uniref:tRNA-splicing endonuclease subunit Sen54 N-terminal domain-containing protein n=2 Tax=Penicillium TaxID=5073 RepID=A0A9W9NWY7_PENCI|nr:uncharacterized protein N7469_007518 [Penicillium citrinum]KAJ5227512.1 hypothetical protein N7469_007518 [Penicillium citrinum]KAJ5568011.1 hypothetical protein N7450_010497 [Penicillium hetheringtonii]
MADKDEDAIRGTSVEATQIETDLSDETQDFRLLNHLSLYAHQISQLRTSVSTAAKPNTNIFQSLTDSNSATLPKRGEKDFEPNPTEYQADVLSASRQAMHNALAHPRLHNANNKVIGYFAPDGPAPPPGVTIEDPAKFGGKGVGVNVHLGSCVYVPNPKGQYFKNMGQSDRWNRVWLLPEEALFLIERGSLDIRWPNEMTGSAGESAEELSIPMSLQAAYASFIGHSGLTLERYTVFTGLKRLGYALARAPGWDDTAQAENALLKDQKQEVAVRHPLKRGPGLAGILDQLFSWVSDPFCTSSTAAGPVVGCGMHRSYNDIYRKLAMIPWYDPSVAIERDPLDTTPPFRVVFHAYRPSTPIKKSAFPPPDFRIAVVNTRETESIPTLAQLGALMETTPLDPPHGEKMKRMVYMRLRHGYRNVILAVVDQGIASYLRISDAAFGKEKLYETHSASMGPKKNGNYRGKR